MPQAVASPPILAFGTTLESLIHTCCRILDVIHEKLVGPLKRRSPSMVKIR
jgi:hypothetical protein